VNPRRLAVLAAGCALAVACYPALKLAPNDADTVLANHSIDAPNPAERGPLTVRHLYYGSGRDKNRTEYRDSVAIKTDSVDASKFVDLAATARSRNKYWGFTPRGMPLNARVWYPDGPGPYPLVLIAHGNHDMRDFSDPGYEYIGQLLASRGYIVASLDMNFINGGISRENDARGWFFLKHADLWRTWNGTAGHQFAGKVDTARIALIGHSRGGEAVGHAAALNRLERYPDDATVRLGFNLAIRSIIAIAPVDGQYRPADRLVPLENVNYLVFHGSHDGDVTSFAGLRTYNRVRFTDGNPHFKAAVFVYRANHGQWNSVWGPRDNGPRSGRILDLRTLMPAEEQRRFAEVYISAFLDASMKGDTRYLPLFRDHRTAGAWLPKTMYITRFQESTFRPVATFDEDIDVTTGTLPGVRLQGDSLATWRENWVQLRGGTATEANSHYTNAVTIGWNNRIAGDDTTRMGPTATFSVTLPDGLTRDWNVSQGSSLQFLLMATDAMPGARRAPRDTTARDSTARDTTARARRAPTPPRPRPDPDAPKPPVDLSVELVDAAGASARVALSVYGAIRRPLEAYILRRRDQDATRFTNRNEMVLQTYTLPLADFVRANGALDLSRIASIRFVFDRAVAGTVVLDEIGFSR
jgi:dienelactone hydrolase